MTHTRTHTHTHTHLYDITMILSEGLIGSNASANSLLRQFLIGRHPT